MTANPNTSLAQLTDEHLIALCRAGEAAAWNTLVERFQRLIYTVPRRARLSEAEAADVFQETFTRLFEHLHRLDDPSRVRAWLVTTARRETLRMLRQAALVASPAAAEPQDADDGTDPLERIAGADPLPEDMLGEIQQHDLLRRAFERLGERCRSLLDALFLQDPPQAYELVSARLGLAMGSIGPTRARCLGELRGLMATL